MGDGMDPLYKKKLNTFMVDIFNDILKTEEMCIAAGEFQNLSLKEIHVVEAVCNAEKSGSNRAASIAKRLRITAGSLTTAVSLLEKKGFLIRNTDKNDRRVVHILPTPLGHRVNDAHTLFHEEMVDNVLNVLNHEDVEVFIRALSGINSFFRNKYESEKRSVK